MTKCPHVSAGVRDTSDTKVSRCPEVSPPTEGGHSGHPNRGTTPGQVSRRRGIASVLDLVAWHAYRRRAHRFAAGGKSPGRPAWKADGRTPRRSLSRRESPPLEIAATGRAGRARSTRCGGSPKDPGNARTNHGSFRALFVAGRAPCAKSHQII